MTKEGNCLCQSVSLQLKQSYLIGVFEFSFLTSFSKSDDIISTRRSVTSKLLDILSVCLIIPLLKSVNTSNVCLGLHDVHYSGAMRKKRIIIHF